jgi:hypothetical protein
MTAPSSPDGSPLGRCDSGARDRLEECPDHSVLIHHSVGLCHRIEPQNVTTLAYALRNPRRFRISKEGICPCFVLYDATCSEFVCMFRIVSAKLPRVQESARAGHIEDADDITTSKSPQRVTFGQATQSSLESPHSGNVASNRHTKYDVRPCLDYLLYNIAMIHHWLAKVKSFFLNPAKRNW